MDQYKVYEGQEPYLFVSYAHKDSGTVIPLIRGLMKRGYRVWYDAGVEAGTEWPAYIAQHLKKSACVVVFLSDNAVKSHNCRQELTMAINRRLNPLIVVLGDIDWKAHDADDDYSGVEMQVGTLHQLFYNRHPGAESFLNALVEYRALQRTRVQISAQELCQKANDSYKAGDVEKAVRLWTEAAERGNAQAQYNLGCCFEKSYGVSQNWGKAVMWYRKAAEQGYADAQNSLGNRYYNGEGVSQNFAEAVKWYQKSAEQGQMYAQYNLGNCYYNGRGISQDFTEAVKWYRKAAEQGLGLAQYWLAKCCQNGNGVAQSWEEAIGWYWKAHEQGVEDATKALRYFGDLT